MKYMLMMVIALGAFNAMATDLCELSSEVSSVEHLPNRYILASRVDCTDERMLENPAFSTKDGTFIYVGYRLNFKKRLLANNYKLSSVCSNVETYIKP